MQKLQSNNKENENEKQINSNSIKDLFVELNDNPSEYPFFNFQTLLMKGLNGDLELCVIISYFIFLSEKYGGNEFFQSNTEIIETLGITKKKFRKLKDKLKNIPFIKFKSGGPQNKTIYKIDYKRLKKFIERIKKQNEQRVGPMGDKLVCPMGDQLDMPKRDQLVGPMGDKLVEPTGDKLYNKKRENKKRENKKEDNKKGVIKNGNENASHHHQDDNLYFVNPNIDYNPDNLLTSDNAEISVRELIFNHHLRIFGRLLTAYEMGEFEKLANEFGVDNLIRAMENAKLQGKFAISYIQAILKNERDGVDKNSRKLTELRKLKEEKLKKIAEKLNINYNNN